MVKPFVFVHRCIAEAASHRLEFWLNRQEWQKINSVKSAYFQFMYSLCHNDSLYANDSMRQLYDSGCLWRLFVLIQTHYQWADVEKSTRNITYLSLLSPSNNAKASQVPYNLCLFICSVISFACFSLAGLLCIYCHSVPIRYVVKAVDWHTRNKMKERNETAL